MGYVHGTQWTDQLISEEITKIRNTLNIDRMPSSSEIKLVTGKTALINAIRRRGGYNAWANKLKLDTKYSETKFGKRYERILSKYLTRKGYKAERMTVKHPYDLLINNFIKIDVKASKRYYYDDKNYYYTFNLGKSNPTCDIYVCFCINEEETFDKILVIPSKFLKLTQLSIGVVSQYDKYIERWDYLDKFNEFYKKLN